MRLLYPYVVSIIAEDPLAVQVGLQAQVHRDHLR